MIALSPSISPTDCLRSDFASLSWVSPDALEEHAISWSSDFAGFEAGEAVTAVFQTGSGTAATQLPRPREVRLWLARPGNGDRRARPDWQAVLPYLSTAERERVLRFRFEDDRWSYAAAHAALRCVLAGILGEAPEAVAFDATARGKPALSSSRYGSALAEGLHFNISHTRGMVAVAVAGHPVGVDVEHVRPLSDMRQLVIDLMAPEALQAFDAAADQCERERLFFRFWTLAEAFIKATGQGLDQGLDTFAFTSCGHPALTRVTPGWGGSDRWRLGHFAPDSGYKEGFRNEPVPTDLVKSVNGNGLTRRLPA